MARPERFERPTAGTANQCSIQLSYERLCIDKAEIIALYAYVILK